MRELGDIPLLTTWPMIHPRLKKSLKCFMFKKVHRLGCPEKFTNDLETLTPIIRMYLSTAHHGPNHPREGSIDVARVAHVEQSELEQRCLELELLRQGEGRVRSLPFPPLPFPLVGWSSWFSWVASGLSWCWWRLTLTCKSCQADTDISCIRAWWSSSMRG